MINVVCGKAKKGFAECLLGGTICVLVKGSVRQGGTCTGEKGWIGRCRGNGGGREIAIIEDG